jgi:type IV pilus assembly protein PilO
MNELIAKLLKLKTPQKIAVTIGAVAALLGGYYQLFYADISDGIAAAETARTALTTEREGYEKRKIEYLAYRNELKQLQEEQRDLLRVLPHGDELAVFLSDIQMQGELAGLEVQNVTPDVEVPEDLYVKIPVKVEVKGGFHNMTKFFKSLSELRRIVNVEDLSFAPESNDGKDPTSTKLRAKFLAVTYRASDPVDPGQAVGTPARAPAKRGGS